MQAKHGKGFKKRPPRVFSSLFASFFLSSLDLDGYINYNNYKIRYSGKQSGIAKAVLRSLSVEE